ncbi:unnamed protein product [Ostreobium quekettii]|uniref:Ankyrin repeat protein n=1 Tax=Ostreobium quekettii TaxID=121088 RepID=A0A8S1ITX6_9CHLO|nr:unnamed protein product [Ostreobium quekettii]
MPASRELLQSDVDEKLWDAASEGDAAGAKEALEAGADIEIRMGDFNETALGAACWEGHADVVDVLIEAGADVNARSDYGGTPLKYAVISGELAIVHALLKAGASTDGVAAGNGAGILFRVMTEGSHEVAQELIAEGQSVEGLSGVTETPLLLAAKFSHAPIVAALLDAGARPDQKDEFGATPLHFASNIGGPDSNNITRALLEAGADVDVSDNRGRTPVFYAAEFGNVGVMKILLAAGADPSLKDDDGETLESLACLCSRSVQYNFCADDGCVDGDTKAVIHSLLEGELQAAGANKKLWKAAKKGNATKVKNALDEGANIEFRWGAFKETPLGVASSHGRTEVVEVLIDAGADVEGADKDGIPPLTAAVFSGEVGVVQTLLTAGASTGRLPAGSGFLIPLIEHLTQYSLGNDSRAHSLVTPASAGLYGIFGVIETPLILASALGDLPIAEALLQAGAIPDERDSFNDTALHWAPLWSGPDSQDVAKVLLTEGASVDATGYHGATPLHVAAEFGNVGVARALVEAGANTSLENDHGDTAEDVVCLCARSKVGSYCTKACAEGGARKEIEQLLSG